MGSDNTFGEEYFNPKHKLMNFGEAIEALKNGQAVARAGWNGKRMYLFLNKGSIAVDNAEAVAAVSAGSPFMTDGVKVNANLFDIGDNGTVTRLPNINMRAATGSTVTGWLASQTDILAEDWDVLPATA